MKILFIVKNKNEASSRFRVFAYEKYLKEDFTISYYFAEYRNTHLIKPLRSIIKRFRFLYLFYLAYKHDVVFMQRPMSSDKSKSTFFETILSKINPNLIFDFDDALFVQNESKIKSLISLSKATICGNQYLADFAKKHNANTFIIPTAIDTDKYINLKLQNTEHITIGWTGTSGNYDFFSEALIKTIGQLLHEYSHISFLFICDKKPPEKFNFPYEYLPWNAKTEVRDLVKIDIGLMPLLNNSWTKGKCGFKLIQYGTIGIPSVASNVGVNREVILHNKSGYIVNEEIDEWKSYLNALINDPQLRINMGKKAREHIMNNYSITKNYPALKEILDNINSH